MAEPEAVPGVDPSRVNTPGELAACLDRLRWRRGLSYEAMETAAAKLPPRPDGSRLEPLAKTTVGEIVTGRRPPTRGKLLTFLAVCQVAPDGQDPWLEAWERARTAYLARAAGRVRVRDARPRRLGVHAAISVPGASDDVPPQYVLRDVDTAESGVRARVEDAAGAGGFVLLVGGSSVGKTRCAVEAVKALLPEWWLLHPAGPDQVSALAQAPPRRTVVWLDELQRYLDGEDGLTGGVVRALLDGPHPVVIIGTLWPDRYHAYTAVPAPGGPDPWAREREVLDLADVVRIAPEFSPAEQDRARAAAAGDRRLAVALGAAGYGLTQTLAAAPQLVARWENARAADPYAWAVLTAALDVARLGGRAPLPADLLRAAAPGYCTSAQQAEAPASWFEQALAYATAKLHGAAAALAPAAEAGVMGQVTGYTVADYLLQHATRERRPARVPASTWDALLSHLRDPADAARLADSAHGRLLYRYAIPLYRRAADTGDTGDGYAAERLADLLFQRGDVDGLRARADADADNGVAAWQLAGLLANRGDLDELRARADAGDQYAAERLAELLFQRGEVDRLRARAAAGNGTAAGLGAQYPWPGRGGDVDGLRADADAGDGAAAVQLAALLADRGDLDQAEHLLRARADAGDEYAAMQLAGLLVNRRDLDQLRARADAGDRYAAWRLAGLLAECGDLEELRARTAASQLADLLAERGDLDQLRARVDAGDEYAAMRLVELLAERGDLDELRARADAGDAAAAWQLVEQVVRRGDLDELRARADAGDGGAAMRLAGLLAERGDLDELRARADAGDRDADWSLAGLLAERGDLDQAEQLLRARADAGEGDTAMQLAMRLVELLARRGQGEEAERLRRFGLNPDGSIARA